MQAEIAIEKNKNAKKEESQRQREKNQKSQQSQQSQKSQQQAEKRSEAGEAGEAKKTSRQPLSGEVEEATNDAERRIFEVLNAEGIAHVGMGARREARRRIITKRRRPWRTWCDSWTRRWDCRPKTSS